MIKILFVCAGNICRSPMADGVFQKIVTDAQLEDQIQVDSAGTGPWHVGESAHFGTLDVLKRNEIDYQGRARQIAPSDLSEFDYVLAMDRNNLNQVERMRGRNDKTTTALFLSYAVKARLTDMDEVPDPYYTGEFDYVYELVSEGCRALLGEIRRQHNL